MSTQNVLLLSARVAFTAATAFTLYSAFAPPTVAPSLFPWDKAAHFLAFYVVAVLGLLAFPRTGPFRIGLALSSLGVAIELVQGLPIVNRDSDIFDWVADSIGIVCALGPMGLPSIRGRWRA